MMTRAEGDLNAQLIVLGVMLGVLLLVLVALLASSLLFRLLGVTGTNVVSRVLGMLLAALAVQFVIDGIRQAIGIGIVDWQQRWRADWHTIEYQQEVFPCFHQEKKK